MEEKEFVDAKINKIEERLNIEIEDCEFCKLDMDFGGGYDLCPEHEAKVDEMLEIEKKLKKEYQEEHQDELVV